MPPREPELPEGTDQIVEGASAEGTQGSGGFVARAGNDGGGGEGTTERLVTQARDQFANLRGQAGEKIRAFADDGKGKASGLLDELGGVLTDAARSVDSRLGEQYGEYAHRAAGAVSNLAGRVREKNVDDFVGDAREFVRKSPVVAVGIAAVAGFALVRLVRSGWDDVSGGGGNRRGNGRTEA
jgi:ElaB/YqjD/DUF883 family membrane-anchored ribosome-binding protein